MSKTEATTHDGQADQIAAGLAKLALVFRHEAWQGTGAHGLSPTQAQILAVIAGARTPLGLAGIAEQLAITPGTASAAVSTLVDKQLVAKERSKSDARAICLKLTARGARIATTAAAWPESVLAAAGALGASDKAGLVRGLVGLIHMLQQQGAVPTAQMCVGCRFFRPNEYPGASKSHHCDYIAGPIGDSDLRVDCAESEPVAEAFAPRLWQLFVDGQRLDPDEHADRGEGLPSA